MLENKVDIELTGPFREFTGQRKISILVEDKVSLIEFIKKLSGMFGQKFGDRIIDPQTGELKGDQAMVVINGRIVDPNRRTAYEVKPGDKVIFALPLAGGG